MRVTAILMAAGRSRRMGEDKLLLPFRGRTLLEHALELVGSIPVHQRLLVTTPERLAALTLPPGVTALINPRPEEGQSGSLRLGVAAATGDAYLFFTADQPLLDRETVEWLLSHLAPGRIVYPTVEGKPRSPSIFPAAYREELLALRGDLGGRAVRLAHPEACSPLPAEREAPFLDIDSPSDYRQLMERFG